MKSENEAKMKLAHENRRKIMPYDYESYALTKRSNMFSYPTFPHPSSIPTDVHGMAGLYPSHDSMRRNIELLQRLHTG